MNAGSLPSYWFQPTNATTPSPAARMGVPEPFAMSMPLWKWAQLPRGGSSRKPVQPYSWVTVPEVGQMKLPVPRRPPPPGPPPPPLPPLSALLLLRGGRAAPGAALGLRHERRDLPVSLRSAAACLATAAACCWRCRRLADLGDLPGADLLGLLLERQ